MHLDLRVEGREGISLQLGQGAALPAAKEPASFSAVALVNCASVLSKSALAAGDHDLKRLETVSY